MLELLSPDEMAEVDRVAIAAGPFDGAALMRRAGEGVAGLVLARYPQASVFDVLCGPGNNGGDGYVIAEALRRSGASVAVFAEGSPRSGSDAEMAAASCTLRVRPLTDFAPTPDAVVIDALYGAGLVRDVSATVSQAIDRAALVGSTVVAVDLPTGIAGDSGRIMGAAFRAALTITFVRPKPGHRLLPGRDLCGETVVVDIGITDSTVEAVNSACFENSPELWCRHFPSPLVDAHKYSRGHVAVVSGVAYAGGAARLAAMGAARAGAGAVTVLSPATAMAVNAAHLNAIMLKQAEGAADIATFVAERRVAVLVYGPGLAPGTDTAECLNKLIGTGRLPCAIVDAGALTALTSDPDALFSTSRGLPVSSMALTPHEGEFGRVFPDLAADLALSKLDRARLAAKRANAVVIFKGPDTVIASTDGRAAINCNGTPLLATAGSGDVLAGIVAGLAAQGMPLFEACCAAVWLHAEAATRFGPGLTADDLPLALLPVLRELHLMNFSGPGST